MWSQRFVLGYRAISVDSSSTLNNLKAKLYAFVIVPWKASQKDFSLVIQNEYLLVSTIDESKDR